MQKYLLEALGTFVLLFLTTFTFLEASQNVFLGALVAATSYAVLMILFGAISGAHCNPAVSLGAWVGRSLSTHDLVPYFLAQCIGGIGGIMLLSLLWSGDGEIVSLGHTVYSGIPVWKVIALEAVFTSCLTLAIVLPRRMGISPRIAALIVSIFLFALHFFVLPGIPGYVASLNPVRTIALLVVSPDFEAAKQVWVYVLGTFLGGIVAGVLMRGGK
jgi:aquaporin Z